VFTAYGIMHRRCCRPAMMRGHTDVKNIVIIDSESPEKIPRNLTLRRRRTYRDNGPLEDLSNMERIYREASDKIQKYVFVRRLNKCPRLLM